MKSGTIDPATALAAMVDITGSTLPQISSSKGVVTMTLHQINADGAGPMACSVSTDASGDSFTAMTITTQVPGTNGKSSAADADFPLVASMPAGATCTGTIGNETGVCLVKCQNPAGPFGSTVPVQMSAATGATAAAGNTTVVSTGAASSTLC